MIRGDDGKVKPIAAIDRSTIHNEMVFILADESCKKCYNQIQCEVDQTIRRVKLFLSYGSQI